MGPAPIICAATPLPDGGHCETRTVDYALIREPCGAALAAETSRLKAPMRLACTEHPALSAALEEEDGPGKAAPSFSRVSIHRAR